MISDYIDKDFVLNRTDYIIYTIETRLNVKLSLLNINYTKYNLNEKIRLLDKIDPSFLIYLTKDLHKYVEILENKEIPFIGIDKKKSTSTLYLKKRTNRIGMYPLFTYDINGNITKIETDITVSRSNELISYIEIFNKTFINNNTKKRTLK